MGPCVKQRVRCTIITPAGLEYIGYNDCADPQQVCPRDVAGYGTGEGYHLCKEVCRQKGHAEEQALEAARVRGGNVSGGIALIKGHTYACNHCKALLNYSGISAVKILKGEVE